MKLGFKIRLADFLLFPLVYPAGQLLKWIRKVGVSKMPRCKQALMQVGVFPIWNHYYEPLFDSSILTKPLDEDRNLPGIDWNISGQLAILKGFNFTEEFNDDPMSKFDERHLYMANGSFYMEKAA